MTNPPVATAVGINVRNRRLLAGLTLEALSERVTEVGWPMGLGTLSKIERGDRGVAADDLVALARALDVGIDDLVRTSESVDEDELRDLVNRWVDTHDAHAQAVFRQNQAREQYERATAKLRETVESSPEAEAAVRRALASRLGRRSAMYARALDALSEAEG